MSANGEYRLHYWRCEIIEGEPAICDDELVALRWVTVDELAGMAPVFQQDLDVMQSLLARHTDNG